MVNSEFLKNLNKAQKEAVMYLDGPLLIVAGAGSGKTKVLTSRIANLDKKKKKVDIKIINKAIDMMMKMKPADRDFNRTRCRS